MVNRLCHWVVRHWAMLVCGALFVVVLVLHFTSLCRKELTYDEATHYQYGCRVLEGTPRRVSAINSSTMPFSTLHALTSESLAVLAKAFGFSADTSWNGQIKRGRYASIVLALVGFLFPDRQRAAILRRDELLLLVPILVYWAYFNFLFNTQIGIRHVLPVFALATVFCGRLLADPASKFLQLTALILTVWVGASTVSYYPHFLSYFNELVPDRKLAYRYLADSNLDWGGNEWYLAEYIRRHPGVVVDPGNPQAGRIVVPVNILVGIGNPERYRWLREHFSPVDHIAYSFLVYDVKKEMLPQGAPNAKNQMQSVSPPPHK